MNHHNLPEHMFDVFFCPLSSPFALKLQDDSLCRHVQSLWFCSKASQLFYWTNAFNPSFYNLLWHSIWCFWRSWVLGICICLERTMLNGCQCKSFLFLTCNCIIFMHSEFHKHVQYFSLNLVVTDSIVQCVRFARLHQSKSRCQRERCWIKKKRFCLKGTRWLEHNICFLLMIFQFESAWIDTWK